MAMKKVLSVGEVASRCGVNISAIHFYEQKGLIASSRNAGNQRRYTRDVLRRISLIKVAQKVGISLDCIKDAFSKLPDNRTPTKQDWQLLALQWKDELNMRINYLTNLKNSLTSCIGCGCLSMERCPLYNEEDKLSKIGKGPVILNKKCSEI